MAGMTVDLSNRVVVVTGAGGVLGRATVSHLQACGARVAGLEHAAVGRGSADALSFGGLDLAETGVAAGALAAVANVTGRIDGLINVAGAFEYELIDGGGLDTWDALYRINVRTAVACCQAVLPYFTQAGAGRIVNIGALGAHRAGVGMGAYAASKAAVARLTEALADELKNRGVTVNALLPSVIDTPRNRTDMPEADFSRWVRPAEVAAIIAFLLSDAAAAVNGALVPVAGRV